MEVANYYGIANLNAPASINLRDHERLGALTEHVPREQRGAAVRRASTPPTSPARRTCSAIRGWRRCCGRPSTGRGVRLRGRARRAARLRAAGAAAGGASRQTRSSICAAADAPARARRGRARPPSRPACRPRWPARVRIDAYRPQEVELGASMQTRRPGGPERHLLSRLGGDGGRRAGADRARQLFRPRGLRCAPVSTASSSATGRRASASAPSSQSLTCACRTARPGDSPRCADRRDTARRALRRKVRAGDCDPTRARQGAPLQGGVSSPPAGTAMGFEPLRSPR